MSLMPRSRRLEVYNDIEFKNSQVEGFLDEEGINHEF
jgi:hypothetical protein